MVNGISGFTFIHNALNGGYPVFEAMAVVLPYVNEMVVVDMASDDGTRELLDRVAASANKGHIKIVDGEWWPGKAGRCLSYAHSLHEQHCTHDMIWHFEADEVFGMDLAQYVYEDYMELPRDVAVMRIQLEQNFQRVRWYPEPVHRIFPKGSVTKSGHTTTRHANAMPSLPMECGLLWDITNCFRDNWQGRVEQQAELWGTAPNYLYAEFHIQESVMELPYYMNDFLHQPHWIWTDCPFKLPEVLKVHVGSTRYVPNLDFFEFKVD